MRQRVYTITLERCPSGSGEPKVIAVIMEAPVMEKVLTQPGVAASAP